MRNIAVFARLLEATLGRSFGPFEVAFFSHVGSLSYRQLLPPARIESTGTNAKTLAYLTAVGASSVGYFLRHRKPASGANRKPDARCCIQRSIG
jgi:hypothetical protein